MKQRFISALGGLAVLALAMVLFDTYALNILLLAIILLCEWELFGAHKARNAVGLMVLCAGYAALLTLLSTATLLEHLAALMILFTVLFFCVAMLYHKAVNIGDAAVIYAMTMLYDMGMFCWLYMRVHFADSGSDMLFIFFVSIAFPLLGDLFAYFVGRAFGKRKLCPEISPNKTVAGAVGAVAFAPLYSSLCLFIYSLFPAFKLGRLAQANALGLYSAVILLGVLCAGVGMLGDLSASAVKRRCGIKDFGNIMPGHGGAMDRLDSVSFCIPVTALYFVYLFRYMM